MFFIKSIYLNRRHPYNSHSTMGPLEGKLTLVSREEHTMELQLSPEQTTAIVAIVADALVTSTRDLANMLTQQVIDQTSGTAKLEAPVFKDVVEPGAPDEFNN